MPPTQQMQMQMIHRLAAVRTRVDHHTIASGESRRTRNLRCRCEQMSQQGSVLPLRMGLRGNVLPGDNQKMHRRLRVDIREAQALLILIQALRRNLTRNNLAKQTISAHATQPPAQVLTEF
jgi:hypothetical protein